MAKKFQLSLLPPLIFHKLLKITLMKLLLLHAKNIREVVLKLRRKSGKQSSKAKNIRKNSPILDAKKNRERPLKNLAGEVITGTDTLFETMLLARNRPLLKALRT